MASPHKQEVSSFVTKVDSLVTQLQMIGQIDCGCLTFAQAALFHSATQTLGWLLDDLKEED